MQVTRVELNDFKNFSGNHVFDFDKINLVSGENGAGKSTIALHSLLFAIYGYSEGVIADLATRSLPKPNTYVEVTVEYLGNEYVIRRSIPTQISIKINNAKIDLATNTLKQKELEKLFQNIDFFRKFRMIDIKDSINILEQGPQALRKTLVNFDDNINIAQVRQNLLATKNHREKLNKDEAVLYKHFPSTRRYTLLDNSLTGCTGSLRTLDAQINTQERELSNSMSKKSRLEYQKSTLSANKNRIVVTSYCPTCKQVLPETTEKTMLADISQEIILLNKQIASMIDDANNQQGILSQLKVNRNNVLKRKDKLARLLHRLDGRLQQSDYIWSNKDVEVMKKCISSLDGFSTFYITEKLKSLEPLINNILNKLGFIIQFDMNDKNNFDISIVRGGTEYKYKDLSNGQRLLVTVAFQLALLMEKNESGIIVADEGFSSLDQKNLELMFELFKQTPFQLVSVVHRYDTNDTNIRKIAV